VSLQEKNKKKRQKTMIVKINTLPLHRNSSTKNFYGKYLKEIFLK